MLTYIQINAAKHYLLSDGQGLYLQVKTNGSKLWRMHYRYLDKQKTLHLGKWPEVGLADARAKRDEARKRVAAGFDPAVDKKRARIAAKYAAANTFELVAKEWLVKCERDGLAPVTVDKIRWLLEKAYPVIGSLPIGQITPHEALAVLRKVEATGAYESARRMRSVLSRVFRYGVATVRCDKDVAADLRGAIATPKPKHFAAITKPSEVGALMRALDGHDRLPVRRMAMRLFAINPAECDTALVEQSGSVDVLVRRPACRAIGGEVARLARAPQRAEDRRAAADEPAGRGDRTRLVEDDRRIGIESEPPREDRPGMIDRLPEGDEPGRAELGLVGERGRCPLRRGPDARDDDREHHEYLADEQFGRCQTSLRPVRLSASGWL